jgi:hypothetical protein
MIKIDNSPINWWKVFGGFMVVSIIVSLIQNCNNPNNNITAVSKSQIEIENEYNSKKEDSLYKAYKISYRLLKNNLKDSDSFDEIEHKRYFIAKKKKKENTHIQIYIKYRAKNSFGGYVVEEKYFNFDKNLNLINAF